MKILHVDTGRSWRGGQAQVHHLLKFLPRDRTDLHLLAPPESPLAERVRDRLPAVRVHSHPLRGEWDLSAAWTIGSLHGRHGFELIHAHDSHGHGLVWLATLLFSLPPFVVTRRLELSVAQNWFSQKKYRAADHFIAISESVRDALVECGIPAARTTVVPSGVDLDTIRSTPPDPTLISALGLNPDRPVIGNVGALCEQKDQRTFLKAAAEVHKAFPDAQFLIAGEGGLRPQLEALRKELDLRDVTCLAGFQDNIIGLIKTFDLFVLTSRYEGLCSTLLQVMACGIPVVASRVGGVPEIVRDRGTGRLVEPEHPDAFATVVRDFLDEPSTFEPYSERALDRVKRFDYARLGPDIRNTYEEVLS